MPLQHGATSYDIEYSIAQIDFKLKSDFEPTTDTPYLALTGELWGVFCYHFGENWCYNSTALYREKSPLINRHNLRIYSSSQRERQSPWLFPQSSCTPARHQAIYSTKQAPLKTKNEDNTLAAPLVAHSRTSQQNDLATRTSLVVPSQNLTPEQLHAALE